MNKTDNAFLNRIRIKYEGLSNIKEDINNGAKLKNLINTIGTSEKLREIQHMTEEVDIKDNFKKLYFECRVLKNGRDNNELRDDINKINKKLSTYNNNICIIDKILRKITNNKINISSLDNEGIMLNNISSDEYDNLQNIILLVDSLNKERLYIERYELFKFNMEYVLFNLSKLRTIYNLLYTNKTKNNFYMRTNLYGDGLIINTTSDAPISDIEDSDDNPFNDDRDIWTGRKKSFFMMSKN